MFENIIGQNTIIGTIKAEIENNTLPRAILFHGPPYCGKLSTALEIARVLTCENRSAEWNCKCQSCFLHRVLRHPYTLLMGSRYFEVEIAACADVLLRVKKTSAQYLFIRAVRKLTTRFQPDIWEDERPKLRTALPAIQEIEDLLEHITPGRELPDDQNLETIVKTIRNNCTRLVPLISRDNIPINQVRRALYWSHLTAPGLSKFIIIENADRMQDSSRNSLLKILEEPPEHMWLLLLTTRRSAIIQTVASRLRPYSFGERNLSEARDVLNRIFREDGEDFSTLRDYFISWKDLNPTVLKKNARIFILNLVESKTDQTEVIQDIQELISKGNSKETLKSFLEESMFILQNMLHTPPHSERGPFVDRLLTWSHLIHQHYMSLDVLNMNPSLVFEDLYFRMKGMK